MDVARMSSMHCTSTEQCPYVLPDLLHRVLKPRILLTGVSGPVNTVTHTATTCWSGQRRVSTHSKLCVDTRSVWILCC
jgi:hypothetical protein